MSLEFSLSTGNAELDRKPEVAKWLKDAAKSVYDSLPADLPSYTDMFEPIAGSGGILG